MSAKCTKLKNEKKVILSKRQRRRLGSLIMSAASASSAGYDIELSCDE